MHTMRHILGAGLAASMLAMGLAPAAQAHPAAASIGTIYTSTDPAYAAYDPNHAVTPPRISAFPLNVQYLSVYFTYSGASPKHTTFRIDFDQGSKVVRKSHTYTLDGSSGSFLIDLPSEGKLRLGSYQARLYLDGKPAAGAPFSLVKIPSITTSYMITGKTFDTFDTKPGSPAPAKARTFPANVTRVGIYYEYKGASKDSYYGAVYDKYGRMVHRSLDHPFQYRPNGAVALILPANSGAYPAGKYRADIYIDGALATSVPWMAK